MEIVPPPIPLTFSLVFPAFIVSMPDVLTAKLLFCPLLLIDPAPLVFALVSSVMPPLAVSVPPMEMLPDELVLVKTNDPVPSPMFDCVVMLLEAVRAKDLTLPKLSVGEEADPS